MMLHTTYQASVPCGVMFHYITLCKTCDLRWCTIFVPGAITCLTLVNKKATG